MGTIPVYLSTTEIDHGQEQLTIGGKQFQTQWNRYVLAPEGAKNDAGIKMKLWTSSEMHVDETVKAELSLPNKLNAEIKIVAFGDANTPKPDPGSKTPPPIQFPPPMSSTPPEPPKLPIPPPPPPRETPATKTPPVAEAPPEKPKAKTPKTTLIRLKNGTEITATLVVETGDQYSVKDVDGKFQTLNKDDVDSITKP